VAALWVSGERRVLSELRAFRVGIHSVRSRGDREEVFGGVGQSWLGYVFVGGRYLVLAVTSGPQGEKLFGNFPDYTQEEASPKAFATRELSLGPDDRGGVGPAGLGAPSYEERRASLRSWFRLS